jgi:hypothetical protein
METLIAQPKQNSLFEIHGSRDLFEEIKLAMVDYDRAPNSRLLLFLLFSLNHLPEWIAGESYERLKKRQDSGEHLQPNQKFCLSLGKMQDFNTIRKLCNRSKHYKIQREAITSVTEGMTCDSPCNDSLDQVYYWIDGVDSRSIFQSVMREYHHWFASNE